MTLEIILMIITAFNLTAIVIIQTIIFYRNYKISLKRKYKHIIKKVKKSCSRSANIKFIPYYKQWPFSNSEPVIIVMGKCYTRNLTLYKDYKIKGNKSSRNFDGEMVIHFYLKDDNGIKEIEKWLNNPKKPIPYSMSIIDTSG